MSNGGLSPARALLALPQGVRLRPITDADLPFLERVYASTRTEELAQTGWSDTQKQAFLSFQFRAQHHHYTTQYDDPELLVIERDDRAVGRLYLHWRRAELRIIDIALLPEARAQGLGSALLNTLMAAASAEGKAVSIHVEQMNPAMRLYLRLGFRKAGEHGVYELMEWRGGA